MLKMKIKNWFWGIFLIVMQSACYEKDGRFMYDVDNLSEINSEYDDYNSNLPMNKYGFGYLVFSSKRDRKDYFNLVGFPIQISYNEKQEKPFLDRTSSINYGETSWHGSYMLKANNEFNVLGPYFIDKYNLISYENSPNYNMLLFSDDETGDFDIKAFYEDENGNISEKYLMDYLNSAKDDLYPYINFIGNEIYFCSNRDGNFDIYKATIGENETNYKTNLKEQILHPPHVTIEKIQVLSDENADDKCPYLFGGQLLVFTSNRKGGQGGFDIYYSILNSNGNWTTPVNATDRINTPYDEYRPMLPIIGQFSYPLMIFSSNRPSGKGGFDLYMTGLVDLRYW